jgi:hypothetical protein
MCLLTFQYVCCAVKKYNIWVCESNIIMAYKLVIIYNRESLCNLLYFLWVDVVSETNSRAVPGDTYSRYTTVPLIYHIVSWSFRHIFYCTLQVLPFTFSGPPLRLALHFPVHYYASEIYMYFCMWLPTD